MKLLIFLKWFLRARYFWVFKNRQDLIAHQEKQLEKHDKYLVGKDYQGERLLNQSNKSCITKQMIQDNFEYFNAYGFDKDFAVKNAQADENQVNTKGLSKSLSFGLSSGTSGSRGVFISSKKEQIIWAAIILAKMLPGKMIRQIFNPFADKLHISLFLRANNNLYTSINKFGLSLDFYDLNENIETTTTKLNNQRLDILVAPASVLLVLAKKIEKNEIQLKPQLVISVAEVLEKKDYIAEQFKQTIHEIYQCTEGLLAYSCAHGTLHLNESFIKFDEKKIDRKRFMPVITDFTRCSQFYVNYLHEDILVKGQPCTCGDASLTLEKIEGRQDETLQFDSKVIFPDSVRKVFFNTKNEIQDFVLKKKDKTLEIYITPNKPELQEEVIEALNALLQEYEVSVNDINYKFFDYERNNYSIKNKRIINI